MKKTKKLVFLSILLSISLILYFFESLMPPIFFAPGAKLGLSNIISLIILYTFGGIDGFLILFMKVFLTSTFFGGLSTFLYSFIGGVFSLISMIIVKKLNLKTISIVGVSIIGSTFFNIGQLIAASIVLNNLKIFYYIPYMNIISIITGFFIGISSFFILNHLKKINLYT